MNTVILPFYHVRIFLYIIQYIRIYGSGRCLEAVGRFGGVEGIFPQFPQHFVEIINTGPGWSGGRLGMIIRESKHRAPSLESRDDVCRGLSLFDDFCRLGGIKFGSSRQDS